MSEKVKVSCEVADALELARVIRSDETITNMCISKSFVEDQSPLNNLNPYIMVKILINGYEVEQTPEEKLMNHYKECVYSHTTDDQIYARGIKKAVNILGLEIKGINK
ncbi:hypothetical protein COL28_20630 [Bacillus thuringiensis]|uniref:hypothetical protein n=1 Tax=Bacillus thuringiensis TaxID=1428 RepID=UPI000BF3414D|nr:hypothetical protein [Bacillus thuringiensis]PFW41339.1 hypothetical protein COL28_20630 [Bacillus thuringiensis]